MKRVVVTGMGALSPVGNTMKASWDALTEGVSGIGPVTRYDASAMPWKAAGELRGFDAAGFIPPKDARRLDPFVHYAAAAAVMAVEDSGIDPGRLGAAPVIIGSSRGGIGSIEEAVRNRATAYLMAGSTVSMAASYVSARLGARGHVLGISNACSSGANAVGEAFRLIREGHAAVALAGGSEAPLTPIAAEGYGAAGALSKEGVMRPFDRARDGFVLSEGAAVLVLEELEHARGRGARVYGELVGYGNASDAHHPTAPDTAGQQKAIREALAGTGIERVGYINAHATSTVLGDRTEADSINAVFGSRRVPVSAVKSMTGHMLGASGAFESAVTLMSLYAGRVPPTINLAEADCLLEHVTETREEKLDVALSNSFGFGGVNAVLAFARYRG